ncbi:sensor histidine kinase [Pontibacter anaerobius]|uniref:histidine kinase n=1 Tax=Pontibacter anaerobius TaxID=2993940 RepID=A0ABT3RBR5_9BACT|nr:HAMP domain-containing sensor histidine kinase [Pontibacter anaerobius]MCX2738957.1 HAMP domain-containing sensor histidine kinase [Pontibacter anaerobius]
MNRKITPLILLFASLLCFMTMAAMHYNVLSSEGTRHDHQKEAAQITERVHHCIDKAHKQIESLASRLSDNTVSFSTLLEHAEYPVFIYRAGNLVFWSNHTIAPEPDMPKEMSGTFAIENEYGRFVVVRQEVRRYTVDVYIPLQVDYRIKNAYLSPKLDEEVFQQANLQLILNPEALLPQVHTRDGQFLFALNFEETHKTADYVRLQFVLFILGLLLYILFAVAVTQYYVGKQAYGKGILTLLLLLGAMRVALLLLNLPFTITDVELFDPKLYAASFWSPSAGDLLLNVLLLATVAGAGIYLFRKNRIATRVLNLSQERGRFVLVGGILIFFFLLLLLFKFYYSIFYNTPLVLDVSQSLSFTKYKVVLYSVMLVHTVALCMFTYILATVVSMLVRKESRLWPYKMLLGTAAVLLLFTAVFAAELFVTAFLGIVFWAIIILAAQHQHAVSLAYRTYLLFFLVVIVSALTGALAQYAHYHNVLKTYKQNLAFNILQDNDVLGEYQLNQVAGEIAADELIQMKMMGPYVDASFIKRKITRQYLSDYFDKYEITVMLFDGQGRTLESADSTVATLQELRQLYDQPQTRTEHKELFLLKDPTRYNARTYLKLIQVPISSVHKGTIALQLTLKKLLPNSVVPELLVDQKYNQPFGQDRLSYAIYAGNKLRYSEGEYDYATNFNRELLNKSDLFRQGLPQDDYHHYGVRNNNGQTLIITTDKYGGREVLSNFSFLFLVFIAGLLCCGLLYLMLQRHRLREFSPNFSTKIQLFLNFGILLPMLLVSIATAGLVTASYKKDLMMMYEQRGEAIQEHLSQQLSRRLLQRQRLLQRSITEIAAIAEADVNIYDRNGKLLVTSQPLIFETGLLSKLVNPEAFAAIAERQALRVLLQEQAGNLSFNSIYLPLRDEDHPAELAGFIGIPFFDSERELDMKLIELVTTTMNIFSVMFITFMVLTFFASRALTVPLRMLADKLKRTSLTGKNEMLAYEGADEIGMLVNEYNRMLLTLEQNKQELAMQEKEAAWREMARQVAHEIKNPLTPMKLSLQYLQKAIAEKRPNTEQLIEKISHTLITQINILNDIASSFSSFTAMPEPKAEPMDVTAALHKAADLHNDPATAILTKHIPVGNVIVKADESLMVRTFNNLLLNAIQAVPTSRRPHIEVRLELQDNRHVLISIRDNGSGIPKEIQGKVFIPNFSTKYTGSGIGLAVAKRGIENAGGKIWFQTKEGQGTTFFIQLPLADEQ